MTYWTKCRAILAHITEKYYTLFQKNIDKLNQNTQSWFSCKAMRILPQKSPDSDAKNGSLSAVAVSMDFPID